MAWLELHDILARAPRPLCNPLVPLPHSIRGTQLAVAVYFNLPVQVMTSINRKHHIAQARQIAMFLCRDVCHKSLPQIGHFFGNRDHTTVLHACRKIERMCREDTDFAMLIDELTGLVEG